MATRRDLLTGVLLGAGAMALGAPRALGSTSGGAAPLPVASPEVSDGQQVALSEGTSRVGLLFDGPLAGTDAGALRSLPSGDWHPLTVLEDGRDDLPPRTSALVPVPPATRSVEVRLPAGHHVATVLAFGDGAAGREEPVEDLTVPGESGPGLGVVSRAGWGADESLRFGADGEELWEQEFTRPQVLTVHHTAIAPSADHAADIRHVYRLHAVSNGWGDIGYHLLIDPEGRIYEGRVSGQDGHPVFDRDPQLGAPLAVTAGHVASHNRGNIGVCLVGDFSVSAPAPAAVDSLVRVLAALCSWCSLDPQGTTNWTDPVTGAERTMPVISGHRDWKVTQCPGDAFLPSFDELRRLVAEA
ncbi:peptidoglycan recognition protein family protein [Actinoalloteichus spitiensis]|uniref:peptidoglycan recognition protein family protein n=1 Tax=Actinoalloteichus spitiensis TaxID=252394 RepID=UPI00035EC022|nr:peptidoglycan recognition family protein [Actinoalloteichus spitiensis]